MKPQAQNIETIRQFVFETIHNCGYEEALTKEASYDNCLIQLKYSDKFFMNLDASDHDLIYNREMLSDVMSIEKYRTIKDRSIYGDGYRILGRSVTINMLIYVLNKNTEYPTFNDLSRFNVCNITANKIDGSDATIEDQTDECLEKIVELITNLK